MSEGNKYFTDTIIKLTLRKYLYEYSVFRNFNLFELA